MLPRGEGHASIAGGGWEEQVISGEEGYLERAYSHQNGGHGKQAGCGVS